MKIILLKTDQPEAEIYLYDDENQIAEIKWLAHRQLAETIHTRINDTLLEQKMDLSDINGVGVFKGPGSFTGLRIGISVANALAQSLNVPIVATNDQDWAIKAIQRLISGNNESLISPDYGAEPHTTKQKT